LAGSIENMYLLQTEDRQSNNQVEDFIVRVEKGQKGLCSQAPS
jgi:hypothetical protein